MKKETEEERTPRRGRMRRREGLLVREGCREGEEEEGGRKDSSPGKMTVGGERRKWRKKGLPVEGGRQGVRE